MDLQEQGSDTLLTLFRKCNTDSQSDPDESTEEGPSTPSNAHSEPNFIPVDLGNESNHSVLISGGNILCGQLSVGYANVDPTVRSQITPKFQSKHFTDHACIC